MREKFFTFLVVIAFWGAGYAQTSHIVSTSPVQNELNVAIDTYISVTFDTDKDAATINDTTFVVNAWSTGLHLGTISYDSPSRTATFNPNSNFVAGEVVSVVLTTGIQSTQGVPLDSVYIWSFTVETHGGSTILKPDSIYSVTDEPWSIVAADLDGDGDNDIASANRTDNRVSVLLNDGNGKFPSHSSYPVNYWPHSIVAADLDRDGDIDLATANRTSGTISVLMNIGDGTFAPNVNYNSGNLSLSIFAADLNGDGFIDLTTANFTSDRIAVLLNEGDGTFSSPTIYSPGGTPRSIFAADLNGDGNLDLAAANDEGNVAIFFNNSLGSFIRDSSYSTGGSLTQSVFAADLDNDGDMDLVTSNHSSDNVSILYNNGEGTFTSLILYETGGNEPGKSFVADFDGDGDLDISVINGESDNVSILLNDGSGDFNNRLLISVGDAPTALCVSDLDGDGDLDLGVTHRYLDAVSVFLNRTLIPIITNTIDVANDQGRQVRVSWLKTDFDGVAGDSSVVEYSLWRHVDPLQEHGLVQVDARSYNYDLSGFTDLDIEESRGKMLLLNEQLPPGEWDFILTVPAIGSKTYNVIAPTLADSTIAFGMHWSVFAVIAHTTDPFLFFVSRSDSGYSLDNLTPHTPTGLLAAAEENTIELTWERVPDEDFNYYSIYRSSQSGFLPNSSNLLQTTIDTIYRDSELLSEATYYYRISAFDFAGNESQYSKEVSAILTCINDNSEKLPKSFSLSQNYPNPFNPVTEIKYAIPTNSHVILDIWNIRGQKIITLVDQQQAAGFKNARWDASSFASGTYFYRISAGSFVQVRKMMLLK